MNTYAFGASQFSHLYSASLEEALTSIAEKGFEYVELLTALPHIDTADPSSWSNVKSLLDDLGLKPAAAGPMHFDLNLASISPAVRKMTVDVMIQNIQFAAVIGAPNVVVSGGRRNTLFPAPLDDTWKYATEGLGTMLEEATRLGITLCVEPLPYSFIKSGADIVALLDRIDHPNLKGMIDSANCHTIEGIEPAVKALAGRISHIQLSDTVTAEFRHDAIGKGEINFLTAFEAFRAAGYEGPLILELCEPNDPDGALTDSMNRLRALSLA